MLFSRSDTSIRAGFLERFEPNDDGFLFRAFPTANPVRVSEAERDAELSTFLKATRIMSWGLVLTVVAACSAPSLILPEGNDAIAEAIAWGTGALSAVIFAGGWWWLWHAPTRHFERRPPAGPARSPEEVEARVLDNLSWRQFGVSIIFGLALCSRYADDEWVLPSIGAVLLLTLIVQAARKSLMHRR